MRRIYISFVSSATLCLTLATSSPAQITWRGGSLNPGDADRRATGTSTWSPNFHFPGVSPATQQPQPGYHTTAGNYIDTGRSTVNNRWAVSTDPNGRSGSDRWATVTEGDRWSTDNGWTAGNDPNVNRDSPYRYSSVFGPQLPAGLGPTPTALNYGGGGPPFAGEWNSNRSAANQAGPNTGVAAAANNPNNAGLGNPAYGGYPNQNGFGSNLANPNGSQPEMGNNPAGGENAQAGNTAIPGTAGLSMSQVNLGNPNNPSNRNTLNRPVGAYTVENNGYGPSALYPPKGLSFGNSLPAGRSFSSSNAGSAYNASGSNAGARSSSAPLGKFGAASTDRGLRWGDPNNNGNYGLRWGEYIGPNRTNAGNNQVIRNPGRTNRNNPQEQQ